MAKTNEEYDDLGGIIINCRQKKKSSSIIDELESMDNFMLPSAIKAKTEDKKETKEAKAEEQDVEDQDWLDVISTFSKPKTKKNKKLFKGFKLGDDAEGDGKKKKDKKNKDYGKEFDTELALLRNMSKDQSAFVDSLQKKFNQMQSVKSPNAGISKYTTDTITAISNARNTGVTIVKEIINTKKTIADLNFKERKEFSKDGDVNSDKAQYASSFLNEVIKSGRKNYLGQSLEGAIDSQIAADGDELFDFLADSIGSLSEEDSKKMNNSADVYIKYENAEVKQQVVVHDDGTYDMRASDKDGNIVEDFPLSTGLNFKFDKNTMKATDQYGRKYDMIEGD